MDNREITRQLCDLYSPADEMMKKNDMTWTCVCALACIKIASLPVNCLRTGHYHENDHIPMRKRERGYGLRVLRVIESQSE